MPTPVLRATEMALWRSPGHSAQWMSPTDASLEIYPGNGFRDTVGEILWLLLNAMAALTLVAHVGDVFLFPVIDYPPRAGSFVESCSFV